MDQGSVEDGSSSEGGDHQSSGGGQDTPLRGLTMPSVEDINLNYTQYQEVLKELSIRAEEFTQVSLDKMYQILTCNQSKHLRSQNLFHLLLVIQTDLCTFEEVKKPDANIDEECDYGGFTNQGRFVFFQERQYDLVRTEFKQAQINFEVSNVGAASGDPKQQKQ